MAEKPAGPAGQDRSRRLGGRVADSAGSAGIVA